MSKEKNPFKALETNKKTPEEVRENVIKEVSSLKLLGDLGDLFFLKYPSAIEEFFKSKKK